jgi:hypothetical protein
MVPVFRRPLSLAVLRRDSSSRYTPLFEIAIWRHCPSSSRLGGLWYRVYCSIGGRKKRTPKTSSTSCTSPWEMLLRRKVWGEFTRIPLVFSKICSLLGYKYDE